MTKMTAVNQNAPGWIADSETKQHVHTNLWLKKFNNMAEILPRQQVLMPMLKSLFSKIRSNK